MRLPRLLALAIGVTVASIACGTANAGYSNFGPGFSYGGSSTNFFTGKAIAMSFTADTTGDVSDIYAAFVFTGSSAANPLNLTLHTDNAGTPGAALGSWNIIGPGVPYGSPPAHVEVGGTVSIVAGQTYWLSAKFTSLASKQSGNWAMNSTGATGLFSQSLFGGAWSAGSTQTTGAFAVLVPAPSALGVLMLGGLLGARRRRPQ